ncbi:LytR/AlgR family response regulator transcription factor [Phnomibacter ginsenosidimutans]|uniref:Response regulator n=1 Tax=Phnomibacter ginsenosidimutans TaxID=2676868 RepID=A0A6I6GHA4_9BACT|nr:LytTR family DNA-binding domain-containing protein [Phnomibacter ginsenosidimutans]QGW29800.1 response regulator [Phnomibacter ginsenosidimutans]
MPIRCIAIDDEPLALELIQYYVSLHSDLQLLATFDDALQARQYLQTHEVDLLFADINMPDINGLQLVESLSKRPMVVFTTAYKKFAYEGFELQAIDYLLKPIGPERFATAIQKVKDAFLLQQQKQTQAEKPSIYVRSDYKMLRIVLDHIQYIEGLEDYIRIHVDGSRPVLTLMSLKAMEETLPADLFIRIHRSYIIPIKRIVTIQAKEIQLPGISLPIGKKYQPAVLQLLGK